MAPEFSENTNVKTPLTFLLKVFGGTIFVVYSAMLIYARLNTLGDGNPPPSARGSDEL